jgi:hypothetical protein
MARKRIDSLVAVIACIVASYSPSQRSGAQSAANDTPVVGTWRGNSTCMVKESPCRDEVNVYRIFKIEGKPGVVSVTGSKIVEGKEIVMGKAFEWKYDPQKHVLESPDGSFRFVLDGDNLEGTLTKDRTVFRRVSLKRLRNLE